jgi:Tfp pilus assembly protein PilN
MIKKLEAEKRAKVVIEQELNDSREANLRMAANNRFLRENIASVSRLEERIDELEERRKKTIHENNKVLEEISRLTSKRIANLNKMRETIEDNHTRHKRKSSECEIVSVTVKSKKTSN